MAQHQQTDPTTTPAHAYTTPPRTAEPRTTAWIGWVIFAAVIMMIIGIFNAIAGVVALLNDEYYLVTSDGLVLGFDYSTWGWALLIYGVVVGLAGLGVLAGQMWARVVGVILAALNAVVNLTFIAAYPIWSVIIITLDVIVIYALVVHGRETRSLT